MTLRTLLLSAATAAFLAAAAPAKAGPEDNTAVASRTFLEKMGQGRFDRLNEIYGPGFVAHAVLRQLGLL